MSQRIYSTRAREHLRYIDEMVGKQIRQILSDPDRGTVHARLAVAMDILVAHVLSTLKLELAAQADEAGPSR